MPDKKYEVIAAPQFLKDLKKIEPLTASRVSQAIQTLALDPYSGRKLANIGVGKWRYRIGDYRIRYDIEGNQVYLYRIRHRKDIYL